MTIVTHPLRYSMRIHWTFRLGVWVASLWSLLTTAISLGILTFASPLLAWSPGQDLQLGWVLPSLGAALLGLFTALVLSKRAQA